MQSSDAGSAARPDPPGRFRGPRIIAAGFLGHFVSVGCTLSIYGVFIEHVATAFGASMAAVAWGPSIYTALNGTVSPALGRALGRISIRRVMLLGGVLIASGLAVVSRCDTLAQAGVAYAALVAVGAVFVGSLPSSTLIAHWFVVRRGWALGIAAAGTTGASVVFPPLAAWLIDTVGWRDAMLVIAGVAVSIAVPAVLVLVVNRPEDVGQEPDGTSAATPVEGLAPARAPAGAIGNRELLRDRNLWLIGISFALIFASGSVGVLFMVPYGQQLGLSLQASALLLSLRSAMGMVGKVALGTLSDRLGPRPVIWGAMGVQLAAWVALLSAPSVPLLVGAGVVLGFTGAALYPLRGALVGAVFGRESFAVVSGALAAVGLPFGLFAAPLAGHLHDVTGDYTDVFRVFLVAYALAPVPLIFLRMKPAR